jgi:chromosome segregation ATPase
MNLETYKKENLKINSEIEQRKNEKGAYEMTIKTQEDDIARLKYVISEAEIEKQKQRKDYDMVINERDILGNQLIKRNEELTHLYEKIKIQQSTLKKGEIYYNEKYQDIQRLKEKISLIKREIIGAQNETSCIADMKKEIYQLQKEF